MKTVAQQLSARANLTRPSQRLSGYIVSWAVLATRLSRVQFGGEDLDARCRRGASTNWG